MNTYVIDDGNAAETSRSFTIVKDQLIDGFSRIKPESVNVISNKTIEMLVPDIGKKACEKSWSPTISGVANPGAVDTKATAKGGRDRVHTFSDYRRGHDSDVDLPANADAARQSGL